MLNLILEYKYPETISAVSGIPENWNRSFYNKREAALQTLEELVKNINAKYAIISYNCEGFIAIDQMKKMLKKLGSLQILETKYNTFRGARNLGMREIYTKEYLFLLKK
jgi:adenine-specific DNA-methyltransferase